MSALKELIDRIARVEIDAQEAVPDFRRLLRTNDPGRPAGHLTFEQKELRAMADDYGDYRGTFSEVTAAWIAGRLSDEQYQTLRGAVTESAHPETPETLETVRRGDVKAWDDFSDIDDPDV